MQVRFHPIRVLLSFSNYQLRTKQCSSVQLIVYLPDFSTPYFCQNMYNRSISFKALF